MRTPLFLLSSLDVASRLARGGLTLGLAATLLAPAGCETAPAPAPVQIVDPSITPYAPLQAALPETPLCVIADAEPSNIGGMPAEDMAMMVEPEPSASAPRAPRALSRQETTPWRSGRSIAATATELFVVDTNNGVLVVLDPAHMGLIRTTLLGATTRPEQVVVGPEGDAWVTLRHARSVAHVPAGGDEADLMIDVGTEPYGLALSPDGSRLFVTLAGEDELLVLDGVTGELLGEADTAPHPRSVVFSDRETVVVVHQDAGLREYAVAADGTLGALEQDVAVREGNPWQVVTDDFFAQDLLGIEDGVMRSHYATRAVAATTDPERGDVYVAHVQVAPGTVEQLLFASMNGPAIEFSEAEPEGGDMEPPTPGGGGSAYGMGASTRFGTPFRPVEPSITRLHGQGTTGTTGILAP
ncbi:MAG: hypothetical protein QF464_20145, partial [Myxococcota bacterium]|nr:hypothetical protein [Myxococcota bacterium]